MHTRFVVALTILAAGVLAGCQNAQQWNDWKAYDERFATANQLENATGVELASVRSADLERWDRPRMRVVVSSDGVDWDNTSFRVRAASSSEQRTLPGLNPRVDEGLVSVVEGGIRYDGWPAADSGIDRSALWSALRDHADFVTWVGTPRRDLDRGVVPEPGDGQGEDPTVVVYVDDDAPYGTFAWLFEGVDRSVLAYGVRTGNVVGAVRFDTRVDAGAAAAEPRAEDTCGGPLTVSIIAGDILVSSPPTSARDAAVCEDPLDFEETTTALRTARAQLDAPCDFANLLVGPNTRWEDFIAAYDAIVGAGISNVRHGPAPPTRPACFDPPPEGSGEAPEGSGEAHE